MGATAAERAKEIVQKWHSVAEPSGAPAMTPDDLEAAILSAICEARADEREAYRRLLQEICGAVEWEGTEAANKVFRLIEEFNRSRKDPT